MVPPERSEARHTLFVLSAIFGAVVAFWTLRVYLPGTTDGPLRLASDLWHYYYPLYELTAEWLAAGRAPLWNAHHLTGLPWLATSQAGVFYPPHVLYLWLPTPLALAASGLLHVLGMGVATAWLARKLCLSPVAVVLAALWFALCRPVIGWLLYPSALEAVAWLPLGCVGVVGLARGEGARAALWLAAAMALSILAGFIQATVFCGLTWASLLLALVLEDRSRGARVRIAAAAAGAVALGVLLACAQLLPTIELTREGTRAAGALDPALLRARGEFWSWASFAPATGVLRGVALLLVPAALLGRRRALALWALLLAAVSYALASPELGEVYRRLPVLGWFAVPNRLLIVTSFALAIGGALGLDALRRLAATRSLALSRALVAGLVVLAAAELAVAPGVYKRLPYRLDDAEAFREHGDLFDRLRAIVGEARLASVFFRPNAAIGLAARHELRWLDGFEPMTLRRQSEYFGWLERGRLGGERRFGFAGKVLPGLRTDLLFPPLEELDGALSRRRLLDLAAMRWLITARAVERTPAVRQRLERAGLLLRDVLEGPHLLFENRNAVPRAYVSYRALPAPPPERLFEVIARADFDPLAASYVEHVLGVPAAPVAPARGHAARVVIDEATRVEVEARLAAPGLLVLTDAFAAGWSARVDGEPAPLWATNHLFRGVPVPAGRHSVRFEYRAPGLAPGLALSGLGLGLAGAIAVRARRVRRAV